MTCKVEGCHREKKTKGYCEMHYKRIWRHGDLKLRKVGRSEKEYTPIQTVNWPASKLSWEQ